MDIDLWIATGNRSLTAEVLAAIGTEAEQRGIATLWVGEHVVLFDEYDSAYPYAGDGRIPLPGGTGLLEPFAALSFLAAVTSSVRLGTGICILPQRNPVYTAKSVASLDWLSDGRVDFGVGVGWLREEYEVLAAPWPERGARLDEYLEICRRLWRDEQSSFDGRYYRLPPCAMFPKPRQAVVPVHVGGDSQAALQRAASVGAGWISFDRSPEVIAPAIGALESRLTERERHRAEVRVTVCPMSAPPSAALVRKYERAGVDAIAFPMVARSAADVAERLDVIAAATSR
jgi:probable F420-dependent oxidoreductase